MKTISDTMKNASVILAETLELEYTAKTMAMEAAPYAINGQGRPMPKFLRETSMNLKSLLVADFGVSFSGINEMLVDGTASDDGFDRLTDACNAFDSAQKFIYGKSCILKTEDERKQAYGLLSQVVGDLAIFISTQFGLYCMENNGVMLSVMTHCERAGITPDVLYGLLLQDAQNFGQTWYAWEPISPLYEDLMAFDQPFVEECRNAFYPLSDATAERLVSGKLDLAVERNNLAEFIAKTEETETDEAPASMVQRMRLG